MTVSLEEAAFYEYFRWLLPDEQIIQCDHEQLNGKELDLWFPERHVAIEIGSWFVHQKSADKDKKKRRLAKAKGIRLISVFTGRKHKDAGLLAGESELIRCPNNPDILWVSFQLGSGHMNRGRFLSVSQMICENLDIEYREPDDASWNLMLLNANDSCDSKPSAEKTAKAKNSQSLSYKSLAESMTTDWKLVFDQVSRIPSTEKNGYAVKLINKVFPLALGIKHWPQPTIQRLMAQAVKEVGQVPLFVNSEPAATYTIMYGLTKAFEHSKMQCRIVSLAVGSIAESFAMMS